MMLKSIDPLKCTLAIGVMFLAFGAGSAAAQASDAAREPLKVFGAAYSVVPPVEAQQAQIVYYRAPTQGGKTPTGAHVYVDSEFHTALLPNGYTVFCVAPGDHTLGAYLNEGSLYPGKSTQRFQANLKAGQTYFLKVREDGSSGAPQAVQRAVAEQELATAREQVHMASRASTVQQCVAAPVAAAPTSTASEKRYTLNSDVLFSFAKHERSAIQPAGYKAVRALADSIRKENQNLQAVTVIGHADLIGSNAAAETLARQRAETVRNLLIEGGIPANVVTAQGKGNREPLVSDCRAGNLQARIACNATNRRVEVLVTTRHNS